MGTRYRMHGLFLAAGLAVAAPLPADDADLPVFREIMRELEQNLTTVTQALVREDWESVRAAAMAIAEHPDPPMGERRHIMARATSREGVSVPKVRATDQALHKVAAELAEAAERGDMEAVLDRHARVVSGCVACHDMMRPEAGLPPLR